MKLGFLQPRLNHFLQITSWVFIKTERTTTTTATTTTTTTTILTINRLINKPIQTIIFLWRGFFSLVFDLYLRGLKEVKTPKQQSHMSVSKSYGFFVLRAAQKTLLRQCFCNVRHETPEVASSPHIPTHITPHTTRYTTRATDTRLETTDTHDTPHDEGYEVMSLWGKTDFHIAWIF